MTTSDDTITTLFLNAQARIKRYFFNKTRSLQDAEDLAQEAWIKLARNDAVSVSYLDGYLGAIARSLAIDHARKKSRRLSQLQIDEILELGDEQPDAERQLIDQEQLNRLLEIIGRLPERQREAFRRSRIDGQRHSDIASALSVSIRTVEMDIRKAHDFCRENFARFNRK
jgi:RNA polymerase sigma-70 factor (ECF subfamily)